MWSDGLKYTFRVHCGLQVLQNVYISADWKLCLFERFIELNYSWNKIGAENGTEPCNLCIFSMHLLETEITELVILMWIERPNKMCYL